jgi:YHS domain-containing protein
MAWPKASAGAHARGEPGAVAAERVRDVVCGMMIDPGAAAATSVYRGETFYFCAPACKEAFDAEPARFAPARGMLARLRRR